MLAVKAEPAPMSDTAQRASFFRQSGWLMIANIAGGILMWAVHLLNKAIPTGEYGKFGAFLAVVMLLPTIPLQMLMAQQTAKALANRREGELAGLFRMVWGGTFVLWLLGAIVVLLFQNRILERWHMTNPYGLWMTLPVVLLTLWLPMFWGALQGQQNFLWFGWSMLSNAIVRLMVAAFAVLVLHAYAAGMMGGVLFGTIVAAGIGAWQTRALWLRARESFDWLGLARQVIPLMIAFLGFQILFTADTIFAKAFFPEDTVSFYVSAGTMSRALMWLVGPLAAVMFPRLVHSSAKAEKNNLMNLVLFGTAALAVCGAISLSILGPWVVRILYGPAYVKVASAMLPWYSVAMVPLALANVLLNNILARPAAKWGLAVCVLGLSLAYMVGLTQFHETPVTVLKVMGLSNLLLLAICVWFSRSGPPPEQALPQT